jgi:adenylate kinase
MKDRVLIILGAPGSGKGTQSALLAEQLSFYHVETSKVLENAFQAASADDFVEVEGKKHFIKDEKKNWETGVLCSPPFVNHLIEERIKDLHKEGENLILSGSPRTLWEGEKLIPLLKGLYGGGSIKVVVLMVTPAETLFRNSHRRICKLIRHPILYSKDNIRLEFCPLDGSKLLKRKGLDDADSIKVRLKEYKERTLPLVKYFKQQGLAVKELSGSLAPSKVFENILKVIDY